MYISNNIPFPVDKYLPCETGQRTDEIKEIKGGCGGGRTKEGLLEEVGKSRFPRPRISSAATGSIAGTLHKIYIISYQSTDLLMVIP